MLDTMEIMVKKHSYVAYVCKYVHVPAHTRTRTHGSHSLPLENSHSGRKARHESNDPINGY